MHNAYTGLPDSAAGTCGGSGAVPSLPVLPGGKALWEHGGLIPGLPGVPAFSFCAPDPSSIPIIMAVPHAGRAYPAGVTQAMRHPHIAAPRLEDRLIDLVGLDVAHRTGAGILVAHAPRAMVDLNRGADDVDWDMIVGGQPCDLDRFGIGASHSSSALRRARSGLGLVPRRLPALGDIWRGRLAPDELLERITDIHSPYHTRLASMLEAVCARWGAVLLIDLHSMPPLPSNGPDEPPASVVLGDRFGAACDSAIVGATYSALTESGWQVAHNRPYAGGFVLERHAARNRGVFGLQIEIDRQTYLDQKLAEPGEGYAGVVDRLAGLVRRLAATVADCGRDRLRWRAAAE